MILILLHLLSSLIACSVLFLVAHTPDNSFLGFVVEQHLNASDIKHIDDVKRQNQSLVYGKVDNFWKVRSFDRLMFVCHHIKSELTMHYGSFESCVFSDVHSQSFVEGSET